MLSKMMLVCLLGFIALNAQAQIKELVSNKPFEVIDKNKPSIYLVFDRQEEILESCTLKKKQTFRLKLQNNTTRPINIDATCAADLPFSKIELNDGAKVLALPNGTQIRLCYQPEAITYFTSKWDKENGGIYAEIPTENKVPDVAYHCSCKFLGNYDNQTTSYTGLWLQPGGYVFFNVPIEYLTEGLKIYTLFYYEWDFVKGEPKRNEPRHQVYFSWNDLPKTYQK